MRATIAWWDLTHSEQTIDSLRTYLRDEGVRPWSSVRGLRLKFWIADRPGNRWGAVMLWESDGPGDQPLPPHRAVELIGYPPTERVRFDVEATVEGVHSTPVLGGLGPAGYGPSPLVLPEFDEPPADPVELFRRWLRDAVERGVAEPGAVALATAGADGRTTNRMVQTIEVTDRGLVFTSHAGSRKGQDIAATGWASGVLYWRETKQQVVLTGRVAPLSAAESDALWASRPPGTHPMSVASRQSDVLDDEEQLRALAKQLAEQQAGSGEILPRPQAWLGYELVPSSVEFWHGSADRLHRRLRYDRAGERWTSVRLQP